MENVPDGLGKDNRQIPGQIDIGGNIRGGGNGGLGMMASTSIVTYIVNRIENIKLQLAGELPTTGNATMSNFMRGNRNR